MRRTIPILVNAVISVLLAAPLLGAPVTAQGESPAYYLPVPEGTNVVVSGGNGRGPGRSSQERYAFDFTAGEGTLARFPVAAARGGTVLSARYGVRGGRCTARLSGPRPDCWMNVNHVLIDHGDGTAGLYLHLQREDARVRRGDVVSAGQVIGRAGNSGWTDEVGLRFLVERTPAWNEWGGDGWFLTESEPIAFMDTSVLDQNGDGVPQTGDLLTSDNGAPLRAPFRFERRSVDLPALVPLAAGEEQLISTAYDPDSADGYGIEIAAPTEVPVDAVVSSDATTPDALATGAPLVGDVGTAVRPLFDGTLVFAGCATGTSASLGRTVVVRRALDDGDYFAVLGHLSDIEPSLLEAEPEVPIEVGPNDVIGHYGAVLPPGEEPALRCAEADPGARALYAGILRNAQVSADGEINAGTPVSPEPLVGFGGYEGLAGWSGPVRAELVNEEPGRPRGTWNRRTPAHSSHIPYGDPVALVARVRDATDIAEVRLRAYYPSWPRARSSEDFDGFDPRQVWRLLAVCRPPGSAGEPGRTSGCTWDGTARDALVTYEWDPTAVEGPAAAPWLPRARNAMGTNIDQCVPVSLAFEVIDTSGRVLSPIANLPKPSRCDLQGVDRSNVGRVIYLDPFVPPVAPGKRGSTRDRAWPPPAGSDPNAALIRWQDRSDNEDGFTIYVRRSWLESDCSVTDGPWHRVTTVDAGTQRYRPNHKRIQRQFPAPEVPNVPGTMNRWEFAVSAFNGAGESSLVRVGGFLGGGEAFCDVGLEPPPGLQ